ncbi:MAG: DUF427 domain-containing protein [Nitriliruptorales bacterium]|nr:DUF427 domain-containing protein [Nitriliruptorales bacterium]
MSDGRGRVRVEATGKRVRVLFGGEYVADSTDAKLVWEKPYYPTYYFPADDVRTDLLVATGDDERTPSRGTAGVHTVKAGDREAEGAALWYRKSEIDEITNHLRFQWHAMDAWFEEDEEVFVHPRDPYTRVDILQSSRHVRVEVDGVTVANTHQPRLLFETNLPTRYYIPKTDVRMDLLRPSDTHTHCPYKGQASYYDLVLEDTTYEDFVWWYPSPLLESVGIAGYVCFYNEKVDLYVDGELQERPQTHFS